jgi:hypothetical protein
MRSRLTAESPATFTTSSEGVRIGPGRGSLVSRKQAAVKGGRGPAEHSEKPISIALESRWTESKESRVNDAQVADLDENSGRCGTRTHDLSRVKAAL